MDPIVARDPVRTARHQRWRTTALASLVGAALAAPAAADDLDVYRASIDAQKKPNVLFVLDYSGSMQDDEDGNDPAVSGKAAKIDILKQAVTAVVDANQDSIRFGIGSLYSAKPSGVRWPASDMRDDASTLDPDIPAGTLTHRDVLLGELERRGAGGATATVNALAEAAAYFRGQEVRHGDAPDNRPWEHKPDSWDNAATGYADGNAFAALPVSYLPRDAYSATGGDGSSFGYCNDFSASGGSNNCAAFPAADVYDCEARSGGSWSGEGGSGTYGAHESCKYRDFGSWTTPRYESPVQQCQANAIILVSDGMPTELRDNSTLSDAIGGPVSGCEDLSGSIFATSPDARGNCGPEVARSLAQPGSLPGDPNAVVNTYTIGFALDGDGSQYLRRLADEGGGSAELATDLETLTAALNAQLGQIGRTNENFAELAVDVDRANFAHEERAYFNLFEPSRSSAWRGNLKGYFLSAQGMRSVDGSLATETVEGVEVFKSDAQSFWSAEADGNDVLMGGASEQIVAPADATDAQIDAQANARTLYTYLGARPGPGSSIALSSAATRALGTGNPQLTPAMVGVADEAAKDALIERLRRAPMGDPLHSRSVGLSYPGMKVVYTMTNQGLLHAFDATRPSGDSASAAVSADSGGGEELWAFMPKRLLSNLPALFDGASGGDHVYGLDGGMTRWHDDDNADGIVDPGETMLLIFGMRRGGDSYYALDVSEPLAPKLAWEIDASVAGFERLGETWSRPALVTGESSLGTDGKERFLVFGGGYDAATLDGSTGPTPARGNGLFVVDVEGRLVASVTGSTLSTMSYAIPADPTVIDSDADGLADRLYVGDLGGQVWRIDFGDMRSQASYRPTRLATLADGSHQPFFYAPSVAYNRIGGETFLSVSLGSGDRTDPMDGGSDNAFFMLRDTDVARGVPDAGFTTIGAGELFDTTDNAIGSDDDSVAAAAEQDLADARGWRVDLAPGEKSLSRVVSFEGKLLATTFEPTDFIAAGECAPEQIGRFYLMDIATGRPLQFAADGSATATPDTDDRSRRLNSNGIPSAPVVLFPKGATQVQIVVDKEVVDLLAQGLSRVFWHAR